MKFRGVPLRSCAQAVIEAGGFNVGARVQTKLYIAWGSKRKLKPIRYGAGDCGMDGCTERAAWGSKRILKCQSTKYTRGGTRTRNLLLKREAPYPLGHTSLCLGMMSDIERPDMIASVTSHTQNRNAKARQHRRSTSAQPKAAPSITTM